MKRLLATAVPLAVAAGLACVKNLPVTDLPCPCATGWECCLGVCIPKGAYCSCVPDCSGGRCGPNECGTSCGACVCNGKTCREDQVCTPVGRCGVMVGAGRPSKVMLVLDRSGSMKTLSTDSGWGCAQDSSGSGYDPTGSCRWNDLKELLLGPGGFLDEAGAQARIGLALFSNAGRADACEAGTVVVPVPETAGASKAELRRQLDSAVPGGGTPTSLTLMNVATDAAFTKREPDTLQFVVLITDGAPNCNASVSACTACTNGGDPSTMCGDPRNCLDDAALVAAVKTLRAKDILTLVIGLGVFQSPGASDALDRAVLDQAAVEGGLPQGGDTRFYYAMSTTDLGEILKKIVPSIGTCFFTLERAPADPDTLEVYLTDSTTSDPGSPLVRGTDWDYTDKSYTAVAIKGGQCQVIQNAVPGRYQLSFMEQNPL
ncbi:MAG: VWA domain-containing protein [Myxococcales bacterium]